MENNKWKEIAKDLYEELKEAAEYSGEGYWADWNDDFYRLIAKYEKMMQNDKKDGKNN